MTHEKNGRDFLLKFFKKMTFLRIFVFVVYGVRMLFKDIRKKVTLN